MWLTKTICDLLPFTGKLFSEASIYNRYSIFLGQSGLSTGAILGVISYIHRVRTNPEVRIAGMGANHDPEDGTNTKNL